MSWSHLVLKNACPEGTSYEFNYLLLNLIMSMSDVAVKVNGGLNSCDWQGNILRLRIYFSGVCNFVYKQYFSVKLCFIICVKSLVWVYITTTIFLHIWNEKKNSWGFMTYLTAFVPSAHFSKIIFIFRKWILHVWYKLFPIFFWFDT